MLQWWWTLIYVLDTQYPIYRRTGWFQGRPWWIGKSFLSLTEQTSGYPIRSLSLNWGTAMTNSGRQWTSHPQNCTVVPWAHSNRKYWPWLPSHRDVWQGPPLCIILLQSHANFNGRNRYHFYWNTPLFSFVWR